MNLIDIIEKYPKRFKELFTWIILLIGFLIGFGTRTIMLSDTLSELVLKEERIKQLEKNITTDETLDEDQKKFIKAIINYCDSKKIEKIVIGRNGAIHKGNLNAIKDFLKKDPTKFDENQFENFIMSLPKEYVFNIPEVRYGSPFVLKPTEKAKKEL